MSSSEAESVIIPEITEGSSIHELISVLRSSFQEKEYDEVERLLILRETKLQAERDNLRRDLHTIREKCGLLEKEYGVSERNRLSIEQRSMRYKHDRDESREQLIKLRGDDKLLKIKLDKAERLFKMVSEELKKVESEKKSEVDKLTVELKKVESEKKSEVDKLVEELKKLESEKKIEVDKLAQELKKKNNEIEKLKEENNILFEFLKREGKRMFKLEVEVLKICGDEASLSKGRVCYDEVDVVVERIRRMSRLSDASKDLQDGAHSSLLGSENTDSGIKKQQNGSDKSHPKKMVENLCDGCPDDSEDLRDGADGSLLRCKNTHSGIEKQPDGLDKNHQKMIVDNLSNGCADVSEDLQDGADGQLASENTDSDIRKQQDGCDENFQKTIVENLANGCADVGEDLQDGADRGLLRSENTNSGSEKQQDGSDENLQKTTVANLSNGCADVGVSPRSESHHLGSPVEVFPSPNITCDSDESWDPELNVETRIPSESVAPVTEITNKLLSPVVVISSDSEDENLPARKRRKIDFVGVDNFKGASSNYNGVHDDNDGSSGSDLDVTCFESYLEETFLKFRRYKEKAWKSAADMRSAFEKDYEPCMNAVCALYRNKVPAGTRFHFDAMSGKALAEYLIDGDPEQKLKKTILEVEQEDPKLLSQCRDLAIRHCDTLFYMYSMGKDRHFRPDFFMEGIPVEGNPNKDGNRPKFRDKDSEMDMDVQMGSSTDTVNAKESSVNNGEHRSECAISAPPMSYRERLMVMSREQRRISFSDKLKGAFNKDWEHMVVVKWMGRKTTLEGIKKKIKDLWQPTQEYTILDFKQDFYGVLLSNTEDEEKALLGGPWYIGGSCLAVQKWTPGFRPSKAKISSIAAWIRLSDLPVQYYHKVALDYIGNFVGRTIQIDPNTLNAERGQFARIAVELDTELPLMSSIQIDGEWHAIEYEGLPMICYNCGKIGHTNVVYPDKPEGQTADSNIQTEAPKQMEDQQTFRSENQGGGLGYGPWMEVQRKHRRPTGTSAPMNYQRQPQETQMPVGGTKFDALRTVTEDAFDRGEERMTYPIGPRDTVSTQRLPNTHNGTKTRSQQWVPKPVEPMIVQESRGPTSMVSNPTLPITNKEPFNPINDGNSESLKLPDVGKKRSRLVFNPKEDPPNTSSPCPQPEQLNHASSSGNPDEPPDEEMREQIDGALPSEG
ncbi:OLC1v1029782C1 [Oldenlandia corymbosa var. corymbosa]|uniref:OLC1v1029782C1 n=1 Tax=Oldenlandia corymbosa var. corymbosa TaxID=529605 RepID=A0AAV1CHJ2_OLDCO|nr:OLC1v1029782C1 [Oldenlandia corymbosa var. corymbosa]